MNFSQISPLSLREYKKKYIYIEKKYNSKNIPWKIYTEEDIGENFYYKNHILNLCPR